MYEAKIMETREPSPSQVSPLEAPIPSVFPGSSWPPRAVFGSLMTASDDPWFDHHALLRWADDGGRWVVESNPTLHEVCS